MAPTVARVAEVSTFGKTAPFGRYTRLHRCLFSFGNAVPSAVHFAPESSLNHALGDRLKTARNPGSPHIADKLDKCRRRHVGRPNTGARKSP